MRADRLLAILILLQTRGRMTAQRLAEEMEVSERTIYRDLDALSLSGVPVYAERGPGGRAGRGLPHQPDRVEPAGGQGPVHVDFPGGEGAVPAG